MCVKRRGLPKNDSQSEAFAGKHEGYGDAGKQPLPIEERPGYTCATRAQAVEALSPLPVGKLEKSCFLWVFVSSSLSYALEGKADYFSMIGKERKATGHILEMGKEWQVAISVLVGRKSHNLCE